MRNHELTYAGLRLARWRNRHKLRQAGFWTMVALGPLLALATFAVLTEMQWVGRGDMLRPVLLTDFVYALVVAAFVARRVAEMIAARKERSAGSKLHMRLVRFFTAIAILFGVFGYLGTQILGMAVVLRQVLTNTGWFGDDVGLHICMIVSVFVLVFYCVTGGIIASVYTDMIQGAVMALSGIIILFTAMNAVDGGLAAASRIIMENDPEAMGPWDVAATLYHCLGIDPTGHIQDPLGRTWILSPGQVVPALL